MKKLLVFLCMMLLCFSINNMADADTINYSTLFGIRDVGGEGTLDVLEVQGDPSFYAGILGPGSYGTEEEAFLEFDLRGLSEQTEAILNLNFHYTDIEGGTGKTVYVSHYSGNGAPDLSDYGSGTLLGSYALPSPPTTSTYTAGFDVDITSLINSFICLSGCFRGNRKIYRFFSKLLENGTKPAMKVTTY